MWCCCFDFYPVASKLDKDSEKCKSNMLLYPIGREAEAIYDSFVNSKGKEHSDSDTKRVSPELEYSTVTE